MRRARFLTAVVLLFALLLSSCESAAPKAEAPAAEAEETVEAAEEETAEWNDFPEFEMPEFRDFPPEAYETKADGGDVTPVSVQTTMFNAKFEGDTVAGSGEAVDGVYRFTATETDGEAWHVKLECNYPTVAGRDYFVTYNFISDVAGTVKFGDFQEFPIVKGENSITGIYIASSGSGYLDLQLGMLEPFTIDFTEVEVKEYEDELEYENALPAPIDFEKESLVYEKHDQGYTNIPVRKGGVINLNYISASWESGIWKSRLYVRTGLYPEAGVRYRVTADVMCDHDMPFEVLFNNGEEEKGYGALYGQNLVADKVTVCEAVIAGTGEGDELILQFSLGEVREGAQIIVGNVRVDKVIDHYVSVLPEGFALDGSVDTGASHEELVPVAYTPIGMPGFSYSSIDTVYEHHDDGYVVSLEESAESATMRITQAPANADDRGVWKAKLYAATGVTLTAGKSYRVLFDLASARDQADYEVCFDGDTENAYGALYGRKLTAGGTDHVEYLITPDDSHGPLTIRMQLGKTDTASGNTVTLKNLRVESVDLKYTSVLPDGFSYNTGKNPDKKVKYVNVLPETFSYRAGTNVYEQHADGFNQSVSSEGDSATLTISEAPEEGRDVWNSKLLINTGVTPKAGDKYNVSFDITAKKDQPGYEVCFDGANENSYGALYDQTLTAGESQTVSYSFTPEVSDGPIVLRFQLGRTEDTSGNTITVSNLKIGTVTGTGSSILPDSFAYPTVTTTTVEPGESGYQPVELPALSTAEGHDAGYDQSLNGTTLTINAIPTADPGVWCSKLFADTGTALEAGYKYKVTLGLASEKGFDFEICYNNGSEEKGYGALYGQSIGDGSSAVFTQEFMVPEDASTNNLVLQLQIGKTPAPNTITVNSVKVEKYIPEHEEDVSRPARYVSVATELSAREGHDAGYEQSLSGMTLHIDAVPESDTGVWKSKLFVDTNSDLEEGAKYKVTTSVSSEKAMSFEICLNKGEEEKGYGALYGLSLGDSGSGTYESEFTAGTEKLVLQFQLGNSPADNAFTVNSVKLEKWEPEFEGTETIPATYENVDISGPSLSEGHDSGYEQSVSGNALNVSAVPTAETGVWMSKLFVDTHKSLEAGAKYKVTAEATSSKDVDFEICLNNGDVEKGYEGMYGLSIAAEETKTFEKEFEVAADAETSNLVLQFQLGNSPAGTVFTVNKVTLEKWEEASDEPQTIETVTPNSFNMWAHEEYAAVLRGDGSSAVVRFDTVPEGSAEGWKTKLFAETGVTLTAGKSYRISADVAAENEFPYEICYNNAEVEKGVGARYGLTASSSGETVVFDVIPENDATLILQFSLGNAGAGNTVTVSNIEVEELDETVGDNLMEDALTAWAPVHTWTDAGYQTELSSNKSSATLKITAVPEDRADWKAKLFVETGAKLKAGRSYRITYKLKADKAFNYNLFYNNGAEEKAVGEYYDLKAKGTKTVQNVVSPSADAELTLQLMLGMTGAPNKVTVSGVKVEEITGLDGAPVTSVTPINCWAHEDYAAKLSNDNSSATIAITKVPADGREAWKVKLFAETGAQVKAGKTYRVSVDVKASEPIDYEICYNNLENEKALGALYGLQAFGGRKTVTYNITPETDSVLTLQFSLGNAAGKNNFTISNIKVEEIVYASAKNVIPSFRHDSVGYISRAADAGYITSLTQTGSSATFRISQAPASDRNAWNAKVIVRTGITPRSGQGYRVRFNVYAARSQNLFEVFYDGSEELAYGALYERTLSAGRNSFDYIIMPGDSKGELTMQLRFGKTNGTDGNTYTISDFSVDAVTFENQTIHDIRDVSVLALQEDYQAELEKTPDKDTVRLVKTPAEGREAWKNKLFIHTGAILKADGKYRVSMKVKSIIPAPFEVCYNDLDVEKGLGGIFGLLSRPAGTIVEYTTYLKKDIPLVIQLSLGNCTTPNNIIVEDVKVEEAGRIYLVSDTIYHF